MRSRVVWGIVLTCLAVGPLRPIAQQDATAGRRLALPLDGPEWQFSQQGPFSGKLDRRGVFTISHPHRPAGKGDYAQMSRLVKLAGPARHGVVVRFYMTDDYAGSEKQPVYYRDAVKEHVRDWKEGLRHKQCLINGAVVWEQDVLGRNATTPGSRFYDLEISDIIKDATQFRLAFRVSNLQDCDENFATDVFLARVALLTGFEALPPVVLGPSVERAPRFRPAVEPPPLSGRVSLALQNLSAIEAPGWPLTVGLPFPEGAVNTPQDLALADASGRPLAVQGEPLCRWPDGTVRWMLLDTQTTIGPQGTSCRLTYGRAAHEQQAPPLPGQVRIQDGDEIAVDTGLLRFAVSRTTPGALAKIAVDERDIAQPPLQWPLIVQDAGGALELRTGPPDRVEAEARGPLRATVALRGWYVRETGEPGPLRYITRIHAYAGKSYLRLFHTFINHSGAPVSIRRLGLRLQPDRPPATVRFGVDEGQERRREVGEGASLHQTAHDSWGLTLTGAAAAVATGKRAAGWMEAAGADARVLLAVRNFWQLSPQRLGVEPKACVADLWAGPGDQPFICAPGEAKRHELLLGFETADGGWDAPTLARLLQDPPLVTAPPRWYAGTEGLGPILPRDELRFPEYEAQAAAVVARAEPAREEKSWYGMQNYGDTQFGWGYGEQLTYWANTEYDHAHAYLLQYLRSGDPAAFRAGEAAARHYMDVDLIHHHPDHPEWVGAPHHHGETHTGHPPSVSHSWLEGLVDYWLLTGDAWARENAELAGKYFAGVAMRGEFGGGERDAGWNLIGLMGLHQITGDPQLLEAAQKKVAEVLEYQDPVRGCCSRPIFEQRAYEGGVPFMSGVLMRGLVMYYEATGDRRVAWAITRLCDWLDCEMSPSPGVFHYKQAPEQRGGGGPNLLVLDGAAFAHNFTGSEAHRQLALATYEQGARVVGLSNMRDAPHALALLTTALPPARFEVHLPPLALAQTGTEAPLRAAIRRLAYEAIEGRVRVIDERDNEIAAADFSVPLADTATTVQIGVPATQQGKVAYEAVLEVRGQEVGRTGVATLWLPALPRIILFSAETGMSAQALQLTGIPHDRQPPAAYPETDLKPYDIVIFGMDEDRSVIDSDPQELLRLVEEGGVFLGQRYQGPDEQWLPSSVAKGPAFQPGRLLLPDAAVLQSLHDLDFDALRAVHGGSMYHAFHSLGPKWSPIVGGTQQQAWDKTERTDPGEHYGLIELDHGWGKIVLCQMIPEYAWINDAAGARDCAGRRMFENLLAYAAQTAAANKQ